MNAGPKAPIQPTAPKPAPAANFAEVRSLFKAQCLGCHTAKDPSGGLNLESIAGYQKGGFSGKMIIPGNPDKSILLRRIRGLDGLPRMPMGFKPLSAEQEKMISDWIRAGAPYEATEKKHWAYETPTRPKVPPMPAWGRNPIDAFIGQRLAREGMSINKMASKEMLIRRLSLDLIGLPPTPEEIDAFLKDTQPGAYERVVDRLLASPHYGERQARVWLDLARFADSDGFEKDLARNNYLFRDWVISAFNRNLPYDRFTIDQLAGDLLPKADVSNLIATGFHRNTMHNLEGGVDQDEAMYEVILDRVGTTGTVWLGSTIACARCHDHKYDPVSQKEFFGLYAFFGNNVWEARGDASVSEQKYFEPKIKVRMAATEAKILALKAAVDEKNKELESTKASEATQKEKAAYLSAQSPDWKLVKLAQVESPNTTFRALDDGSFLATGPTPARSTYTITIGPEHRFNAIRLEVMADDSLPAKGPGRSSGGNFVLSKVSGVKLAGAEATFEQTDYPVSGVLDENSNSGWGIYRGGGKDQYAVFELAETQVGGRVTFEFNSGHDQHVLGRFRVSVAQADFPLKGVRPGEDAEAGFLRHSKTIGQSRQLAEMAQRALADAERSVPEAMVLQERPIKGPLKAKLRDKGAFIGDGPMVVADTPKVLPPLFTGKAPEVATRLDLARWLVRKDNPLTARVQVNRMWESIFGRGIVETSEDFGTQGSKPSHPELLDWLAVEFMDKGWDMKAIMRLIVTSTTYRQSSAATPAMLTKDPANVLLARAPRYRLDAEAIRDAALASSGLLSRKVGGPSVYPPQPEGFWDTPFNPEPYRVSPGEDKYRRGLYTVIKRTAAHPSLMAFDATSREQCITRRSRTNTPLQALVLLNDPAFLEAAAELGKRISEETLESDLIEAFRSATSRRPTDEELSKLVARYRQIKDQYSKKPELAEKLGGNAAKAAATMTASIILNLDEAISRS